MEMILTILGGALGLLVPCLFIFTFRQGIYISPFDEVRKTTYSRILILGTVVWTGVIWVSALAGIWSYHAGDNWPTILLPLFLPVIVALLLLKHPVIKIIVDHTLVSTLVGVQIFRLAGFVFLIIPAIGMLPKSFVTGGYGDIATGILAFLTMMLLIKKHSGATFLFISFTAVGLIDLVSVAGKLLYYYPIWSTAQPSSAALGDFSLVMVPALAAPMALIFHFYAIRNYCILASKEVLKSNCDLAQ